VFHLSRESKAIIGMIHVGALPGTPANRLPVTAIVEMVAREAAAYRDGGVDAIMVENMHDTPYLRGSVGPEIVASMTLAARAAKETSGLPCGIQILAGANCEALGVALATGLDFVRVEGFVFAHVADEGIMESCAGRLLRYRRQIGAEHVRIWADIKKKHASHSITADLDISAVARAAEFFLSDAVIVTGSETGCPPIPTELTAARTAVRIPVIAGSGLTEENFPEILASADAAIVGSAFKYGGDWRNSVRAETVKRLMEAVNAWRETSL
jgi:membrane complex biogenesis BtpA family protein